MDAKIIHFSELSNFLSEKSSVCNDFLLLLDRFKLSQSLHKRFTDYETFGELFRDIREGLLELTFIERLLPIIQNCLRRLHVFSILRWTTSLKKPWLMKRRNMTSNAFSDIIQISKNDYRCLRFLSRKSEKPIYELFNNKILRVNPHYSCFCRCGKL